MAVMSQIDTIVFLMLENRSLDNVLGWLYEGSRPQNVFPLDSSADYNGLAGKSFTQPLKQGGLVKRLPVIKAPDAPAKGLGYLPYRDPTEPMYDGNWRGVMNQMFGNQNRITKMPSSGTPGMQGFLQDYYAEDVSQEYGWKDILWTYTPQQLNVINGLALNYAVSDAWFCSVPTETDPNRAYSILGSSQGRNNNGFEAKEQYPGPTIFNALVKGNKSWGLYFSDKWSGNLSFTQNAFPGIASAGGRHQIGSLEDFRTAAKGNALPNFTYIEPKWGYSIGNWIHQGSDYHPPTNVFFGESFLMWVYSILHRCPQWKNMLFIVTFDEHGGTLDHVAPPRPWQAVKPDEKTGDYGFNFNLFGARVPTLFISPYVKPSTVFRAPTGSAFPFDHTSFIKTFLLWAGLNPNDASLGLGKRVAAAPTFENVLSRTPVNTQTVDASVPASTDDGRALNAIFEGVGFASVRKMMRENETEEQMEREVARYRRDPAAFEAELSKD
jgi:phospholipase C